MAFTAKLDAIEFFRDGRRHIRVYYQFYDDTAIRESCYQQDYGWFVRGDGLVIRNAKKKSPITTTRWTEDGGTTMIRVFYLDDQDNICQCQGTHQLTSQWTSTTIGAATETEIAPDSQLAVARPDKDDQLLRLFYQGRSSDDNAGPLREIRYDADDQKWLPQDNPIMSDAINSTGLSAVSDKTTQAVRLYYQGLDLALREIYCDGDYRWSTRSLVIQKQNKLTPNAPISAICWKSSQSKLQIHIFTVLSANITAISHISYDHPNWKTTTGPDVPYEEHSGIATCRNTGVDTMIHSPICLFYQSGLRAIDIRPVPPNNAPESKQMVEDVLLPIGIPTSLDGAVQLPKDGKNAPQQEPGDESNDKDRGAGSDVSKKLAEVLGSLELERNEKTQMEDRLAKASESLKLVQEAKTRLAEQLAKSSNDLKLERDEKNRLADQLAKDAAANLPALSPQLSIQWKTPKGDFRGVSFSPDSQFVVTGARDNGGCLKVWDAATGSELYKYEVSSPENYGVGFPFVAFSADGKFAWFTNDTMKGWEWVKGVQVPAITPGGIYLTVAFSPDSRYFATSNSDKVIIWHAMSRTELTRYNNSNAVAFSPDSNIVAYGSYINSPAPAIVARSLTTPDVKTLTGHALAVTAVQFSPDGKFIASGSKDYTVRLWDWQNEASYAVLGGHLGAISCIKFSPDGKLLASVAEDWTMRLWDTAHKSEVAKVNVSADASRAPAAISFSPDDKKLLAIVGREVTIYKLDY